MRKIKKIKNFKKIKNPKKIKNFIRPYNSGYLTFYKTLSKVIFGRNYKILLSINLSYIYKFIKSYNFKNDL